MCCRQVEISLPVLETTDFDNVEHNSESLNKTKQQRPTTAVPALSFDLSPLDKAAFSPTFCQQRQKVINNIAYQMAIGQWRPSSLEELVRLIEDLPLNKNQIDRAWIIFYWISQNINYDTNAYFSNQIGAQDADTVFNTRLAVSEGYSSLYTELCNQTGITCYTISGYAKGSGFDVRQRRFDKPNHSWNVITLDNGHSYFVETTWGSGYLEHASRQYKQKLVSHYFLCRPEHMIYKHLPRDRQWQFLAHPITLPGFLMLPLVYPAFFTLGLHIVSPPCSPKVGLVDDEAYALVLIHTSNNNVEISGLLKEKGGDKIDGGSSTYRDKKGQTLWHCRFAPPQPGQYNIFIFAKDTHNQEQSFFTSVVQFAFDIDLLPLPTISYPLTWSKFFDYNLEVIKPANSRYVDWPSSRSNSYGEIMIRSPNNICVSMTLKDTVKGENVENGTIINFNHDTKLWECLFAPSTADIPFELILYAKQLKEQNSDCVAQFDLRPIPQGRLEQSMTFPMTYIPFTRSKCHLFEPLNGVLQKDSTVHFRCRVPGAHEVNMTVDGKWIQPDGFKPDRDDVFENDIPVGQKEVTVWVNFSYINISYDALLKYSVR